MIIISNNIEKIGLHCRKQTLGKELDLVINYITNHLEKNFPISKEKELIVFIEPLINGCHPDIVICICDKKKALKYFNVPPLGAIGYLSKYKILSNASHGKLPVSLKTPKNVKELLDCGIIHKSGKKFFVNDDFMCIDSVIIIEAKISNIKDVLKQAYMNLIGYRCNKSYILMPKNSFIKNIEEYNNYLNKYGFKYTIGFICDGKIQIEASEHINRRSRDMWRINDWCRKLIK